MTNTDHRAKLATKIKALLAMNMGNGCTEAEALSAAGKASELMAEHDLSYTDIEGEIAVEVFGANKRKFFTGNGRKRGDHPVSRVVMSIGTLWDCRCWVSGDDLIFFGEKSDTEHAHSMADLLRQSIDTEAARFLRS